MHSVDLSSRGVLNWQGTEVEEGMDKEKHLWNSAWQLFQKWPKKLPFSNDTQPPGVMADDTACPQVRMFINRNHIG